MSWPIVLLAAAAALSTAGALVVRAERGDEPAESRARHAIVGLGLLCFAAALAALGGALLGAGNTGQTQTWAFTSAAVAVALPLLVVRLGGRRRRPARGRRMGTPQFPG